MKLSNLSVIIIGQEAVCPDGLGRVVAYRDEPSERWIQVDTYVKNRGCRWDVENVTLISPLPWQTFSFTTVAGLMQGQGGLSDWPVPPDVDPDDTESDETTMVSTRLKLKEEAALDARAEFLDVTLAALVRGILRAYLADPDDADLGDMSHELT